MEVIVNQKRMNIHEYTVKMKSHDSFEYEPPREKNRKKEEVERIMYTDVY